MKVKKIWYGFLIIGSGILFATACRDTPKPPAEQPAQLLTNRGKYAFVFHVKNEGPPANGGDTVFLHYCLRNGDSIISCTHYRKHPIRLTLPPDHANFPSPPPLFEGARQMTIGDSISLYYPLPEGQEKPNGFKNADFVIYDIKVLDIKRKQ
ncbi:MAG: hypothetical protein D6714_17195 [Bacteroidetes bacterium]|nr:MAG: hypothetical protein D6714_17195 [Bacteroidota bacterium]